MRSELRQLPELFLERLRHVVPSSGWNSVTHSFIEAKPTTFRVNTLVASIEPIRQALSEAGFLTERVNWYPDAMILRRGRLRDLQTLELYRDGKIYVQSLSSMLPPLILDPQPGETVLDIAAAPGSKTTQIACLMKAQGRLIANDNNRIRFFKLKANVSQQKALNVELSLRYGETIGRSLPESFDRVLVDAPCSSEGRFLASEPASYRYWKPMKIKEMAHKQKRLLFSAISALKPGGLLVYSTCTFAPEENEAVLHWALERFAEMIEIEPFPLGFSNHLPGLTQWEGVRYHPTLSRARRILPTDEMEGFFIARLRKLKGDRHAATLR
ncbi:MAG: RsmB/NOP family class I SAM-dependent RNA methyltransferase [Candidatus Omnitrophica bacterium]|nr:RsmB/NOP family class I SAM-dependent RNA methyltransferase [Candidatus Omnitrophota bacterium]